MSPISSFGWKNEAAPDLTAENLELDRKQTAEYAETLSVPYVAAAPTGNTVQDTANLKTAFEAQTEGTVRLRPGVYSIDNLTVGSQASRQGKRLRIVGAGADATRIVPGGSGRMLTFQGPGDSTSQYLAFSDLTLGQTIGDTTDYAYTEPLLQIIGYTNCRFERFRGRLNGTGTLIRLNATFNSSFVQASVITGRYAIPLEYDDAEGGTPQMDTVLMQQFVTTGVYGMLFRTITNGLNTLQLNGYKTVIEGGADRETRAVAKLNKEAAAGVETIELEAGQGASFTAGDPVFIGFGEKAEVNKVTQVSGDTLKLRWPARYAHNPAEGLGFQGQVLSHGVALSVSSNTQLLELRSCHLEGAATGIVMDEVVNTVIDNTLGTNQDFLWLVGAARDLRILGLHANGSLKENVNNVITVPAANTAAVARLRVDGPVTFTSGQPEPVIVNDPAGNLKTRLTDIVENVGGVPRRTKNVPTGSGTALAERSSENGTVTYTRAYSGAQVIVTTANAITCKQSAEGAETAPGIFFENKAASPKHMLLYQSAPAKIGIQDNSNTKQLQFDVAGVKVVYGSAEDTSFGRIEAKVIGSTDASLKMTKGLGVWAKTPPAAQPAAIATSGSAEEVGKAVDKVFKEYGFTA